MNGSGARKALAEAGLQNVSRETLDRLEAFVALVEKWQRAQNLISAKTLPEIWRRHVADCAQLVTLFPTARIWLDLGSGAGFPGLVVALLIGDRPGAHVHLVESDGRKCAFLRSAIRATSAPATVHEGRVEAILNVPGSVPGAVDIVTARALAPLDRLLAWAFPVIARGAQGAFLKGRDFRREVDEASQTWDFDLIEHRSRIDDGVILQVTRLAPK